MKCKHFIPSSCRKYQRCVFTMNSTMKWFIDTTLETLASWCHLVISSQILDLLNKEFIRTTSIWRMMAESCHSEQSSSLMFHHVTCNVLQLSYFRNLECLLSFPLQFIYQNSLTLKRNLLTLPCWFDQSTVWLLNLFHNQPILCLQCQQDISNDDG